MAFAGNYCVLMTQLREIIAYERHNIGGTDVTLPKNNIVPIVDGQNVTKYVCITNIIKKKPLPF